MTLTSPSFRYAGFQSRDHRESVSTRVFTQALARGIITPWRKPGDQQEAA